MMTFNKIKALYAEKGLKFVDTANRINRHRATVCLVAKKRTKSRLIMEAIAEDLGLAPEKIFGRNYGSGHHQSKTNL